MALGQYAGQIEKSLGITLVGDESFSPYAAAAHIIEAAQKAGQTDVFVSKKIPRRDAKFNDNMRPGFSIYFKEGKVLEDVRDILASFQERNFDGFTTLSNSAYETITGVRYIATTEITIRYDEDLRNRFKGSPAEVTKWRDEEYQRLVEFVDSFEENERISFAEPEFYDTLIAGKENYEQRKQELRGRSGRSDPGNRGGDGRVRSGGTWGRSLVQRIEERITELEESEGSETDVSRRDEGQEGLDFDGPDSGTRFALRSGHRVRASSATPKRHCRRGRDRKVPRRIRRQNRRGIYHVWPGWVC